MADNELRFRRREQLIEDKNGQKVMDQVEEIFMRKVHPIKNELGFRHWLYAFALIGTIYASVVWIDRRMPEVVPGNQYQRFSEERARIILNQLAELGPRVSGSEACEVKAFKILTQKIDDLKQVVELTGANRLELDVQRPSGCFDLKFLSVFTLCYHQITNILVRIGPRPKPTDHSILINCHFDTLPDTPGATDDAVSCAIMIEVLEILAHSTTPLENDVVFLFNGAEENFLQASHGFITKHPWRHSLRAFINLEGTGSGGREILFQAGPGESWLIKTYLDHAPHPHGSVLAQEIFQSGVIPSDTDFRVFRDYGRVSGLDIAYIRNGWLYHTEFDRPEFINEGAIQRSGENVLAVTRALIKSPYLKQPADFSEGNKWVFFDVIGLFTVFYEISTGVIINYTTAALVLLLVTLRVNSGVYSLRDLFSAFGHQFLTFAAMAVTGITLVVYLSAFNLTMAWYSMPELVFPLYMLPMLNTAFWVHSTIAERKYRGINAEMFHYDSTLVFWALVLILFTSFGLASSFYILIHVLFPFLRDPLIFLLGKLGFIKVVTPRTVFIYQAICLVPMIIYVSGAVMLVFDFFVPVMGRLGNAINPEFVVMPLSLVVSFTLTMFTCNLIYISRRLHFFIKCTTALSLLSLAIISTTRVGVPYKYFDDAPRTRRLIALHSQRTIYEFGGQNSTTNTGLFVQAMDYRGIKDLPDHSFLQAANKPDCSRTHDEYCQLPYYTAIHELFPPEQTRWIPLPSPPFIPKPLSVEVIDRQQVSGDQLNLTISIRGGADKMSLHITPLNGFGLKHWSFTPFDPSIFNRRDTYFVFMTYGFEAPVDRTFWVLLENSNPNVDVLGKTPSLELAVATHYGHGKYQNSDTLLQLRSLINTRRKTPHAAVGYWRWAMTMIGGVSEIIVHFF